jgi:hypothetical protein
MRLRPAWRFTAGHAILRPLRRRMKSGVLQSYWLNCGRNLPSAPAFKAALKDVLELWEQDDPNASCLDRQRQMLSA